MGVLGLEQSPAMGKQPMGLLQRDPTSWLWVLLPRRSNNEHQLIQSGKVRPEGGAELKEGGRHRAVCVCIGGGVP